MDPMLPREAAKTFLRAYARAVIHEHATYDYEWLHSTHMGHHGPDYGAHVTPSGHVRVTKIGNTEVNACFRLDDIWAELITEESQEVQQLTLFQSDSKEKL